MGRRAGRRNPTSGARSEGKQCGKRKFESHAKALGEAHRTADATGTAFERLRVYQCPHCGQYHFGRAGRGRRD